MGHGFLKTRFRKFISFQDRKLVRSAPDVNWRSQEELFSAHALSATPAPPPTQIAHEKKKGCSLTDITNARPKSRLRPPCARSISLPPLPIASGIFATPPPAPDLKLSKHISQTILRSRKSTIFTKRPKTRATTQTPLECGFPPSSPDTPLLSTTRIF